MMVHSWISECGQHGPEFTSQKEAKDSLLEFMKGVGESQHWKDNNLMAITADGVVRLGFTTLKGWGKQ